MVANSKAALPTIGDPITATQLANFAKSTATSLAELREAADKVRKQVHYGAVCPSFIKEAVMQLLLACFEVKVGKPLNFRSL